MEVIRNYPIYLHALERMLVRLPEEHPKRQAVQDELAVTKAGYQGELEVDRHIRRTKLDSPVRVLTDLEIQVDEEHTIQIDTLILTTRGIWILEAKRIWGTLVYRENPRRLERRNDDGTILTMKCPMLQLETQIAAVREWLAQRDIHLPADGRVAFTYQNTWEGLPEGAPILPAREVPFYIAREYALSESCIDEEAFERVATMLTLERFRFNPYPLCIKFDVNPNELIRGWVCPACGKKMRRESERRVSCVPCKVAVKPDYGEVILDWLLLVRPTISNLQLRKFLGIQDKHAASRVLRMFELETDGESVNRVYRLNFMSDLDGVRLKRKGSGGAVVVRDAKVGARG
ncbi:NERD domain-containing protein [Bhargavaea ginsengi]|uniref:nuclease-related domain-containing protein n=1 Tax=Bhargavaea ginsengi TaxID=426757 RepID=UPI0020409F98|nr:nuclease-related domain-containing protein [Bhargavaea ginsengi]MCM3088679.1 NERD domain-containing protein [Bhargavaea ginsengi]